MDNQPSCRKRINTPQGTLHIEEPEPEFIKSLDEALPMGLRVFKDLRNGARYGIVVKESDREMRFVKQQSPEFDPVPAKLVHIANQILIAATLAQYLFHRNPGLFWPLTYERTKPKGVEVGIAYTGSAHAPESSQLSGPLTAFDREFSLGFTLKMRNFVEALKVESLVTGITLHPCFGFDVHNRSQLNEISFGFLVMGQVVVCLKTVLSESDPVWTMLRSRGIDSVIHMPAVPLELGEQD